MKIIAVGDEVFVNGLRLTGIEGYAVSDAEQAKDMLTELSRASDVGLILLDENLAAPLEGFLTETRKSRSLPLIFSVPRPGATSKARDYRKLIKQILGV